MKCLHTTSSLCFALLLPLPIYIYIYICIHLPGLINKYAQRRVRLAFALIKEDKDSLAPLWRASEMNDAVDGDVTRNGDCPLEMMLPADRQTDREGEIMMNLCRCWRTSGNWLLPKFKTQILLTEAGHGTSSSSPSEFLCEGKDRYWSLD